MNESEAKELIAESTLISKTPETWIDLGCGSGTFSFALADILPNGSKIIALDISPQHIQTEKHDVTIEFILHDMRRPLPIQHKIDGIILANALHYIEDQKHYVESLHVYFEKDIKILLVEYDISEANQWIPFPIPTKKLPELFSLTNKDIRILGKHTSSYGHQMYAAEINYQIN